MKMSFVPWRACIILFLGVAIQAVEYDYSATTECLEEPWEVQYCRGGLISNSEFDFGTNGWTVCGQGNIGVQITKNGNKFLLVRNRTKPSDSPAQKVFVQQGMYYAFSAWIQVSEGSPIVSVYFRSPNGEAQHGGTVIAEQGCWSMLKGGIISNFTGQVDLTFETHNTTADLWVDSVAMEPFTWTQWRSQRDKNISKVRKSKVKFHVTYGNNTAVGGTKIILKQIRPEFPIGCEINQHILNTTAYQDWFASRFTVTAFGNEMKWYSTEEFKGRENYTVSDAMLQFCEQKNIAVRGHNILWDDPKYQPTWINNLTNPEKLKEAAEKRLKSVVLRYKGRLIAWDVMNENLHYSFFEDMLGQNASAEVYARTYDLDQKPLLFMNDYNTTENSTDFNSLPAKYARKLKSIVSYYRERNPNKTLPMGIGLESRFSPGQPNLVYMRASLDYLASMGFPIWLTEVFVDKGQNQEYYLEDVLREGYAHPAVQGIVIWPTSPFGNECKMCLTDQNFKNTPNGDMLDKLLKLWKSKKLQVSADGQGISEALLLHGDYEVTVRHPITKSSSRLKLKVTQHSEILVHVQLDAPWVSIQAVQYNYSATTECLEEPWKVQYCSGGFIYNSGFDFGTDGWTVLGQGLTEVRENKNGNKFLVTRNRAKPSDSPSQKVSVQEGMYYAFSAWLQVSEGSQIVSVYFRSPSGEIQHGGTVIAEQGCWSMLKGGIISNYSGLVDLTFETQSTAGELWLDNVAMEPFTRTQWRSQQNDSISKVRKRKVKFHVTNGKNSVLEGAKITLRQIRPGFPIGCEINQNILNNTAYQDWFASRFTVTAFGNEMKWYSTEKTQGHEDYTIPDAMLKFCEKKNIAVRGHNIVWDDPRYQPSWVYNLTTPENLKEAAEKRTNSVVSRYKGRLIAWDVVNENLHFSFYEDKLGQNASAEVYARAYDLDQKPLMFMNEYNTIEYSKDTNSIPAKYARKLKNIVSYYKERNANKTLPMGIGLQSRFSPGQPNLVYMRASLDYLASMGFPLWLTEVFVDKGEGQEYYLEDVLREGYSHPAVQGIVIWPTSPFGNDCKMCLTDLNFKNTPNGDMVDKLLKLWKSEPIIISADGQGISEAQLLHGDYEVTVRHPNTNSSSRLKLKVTEHSENFVHVQLDDFAPC